MGGSLFRKDTISSDSTANEMTGGSVFFVFFINADVPCSYFCDLTVDFKVIQCRM